MKIPVKESGIWSFFLLMIPVGIIIFLIPATINMVMKHFGLSEGMGGLQILFFQFGFLLSTITVTRLLQRFTVKLVSFMGILLASCL
ncbi:MAG: hypothetical protein SWK76_06420 [Actinomycetota bacterium]|nr:hypothetical protein [Actinomycetota bacterium]